MLLPPLPWFASRCDLGVQIASRGGCTRRLTPSTSSRTVSRRLPWTKHSPMRLLLASEWLQRLSCRPRTLVRVRASEVCPSCPCSAVRLLRQWTGALGLAAVCHRFTERMSTRHAVHTHPALSCASACAELAAVCHKHNVPLIVDEAHGAHLPFHAAFPPSAMQQGADVAIQSTHKMLSSLTQTAMLHVQGPRVDHSVVSRALQTLQVSEWGAVLGAPCCLPGAPELVQHSAPHDPTRLSMCCSHPAQATSCWRQ